MERAIFRRNEYDDALLFGSEAEQMKHIVIACCLLLGGSGQRSRGCDIKERSALWITERGAR